MVSEFWKRLEEADGVENCLNPCFVGLWSRSAVKMQCFLRGTSVLILVLLDYGLGAKEAYETIKAKLES